MATLTDPSSVSPLTNPSHSQLHTDVNAELRRLSTAVENLEESAPEVALNIEQARLVANHWTAAGALNVGMVDKVMLPLLWNLTTRPSTFEAAMASVLTPPTGAAIEVDIVVSATLASEFYDVPGSQSSILTTKLVIPAGSTTSTITRVGGSPGFTVAHPVGAWVSAVITQIGSSNPGSGLTVQLNRLL